MRRAARALPLLMAGRIIACLRVRSLGRKSLGRAQFDRDLLPVRVVGLIACVPQNILVAQLRADLCSDVTQVVPILRGEGASTGQFGHFAEKRRPAEFYRRSAAIFGQVKNADAMELRVCFSQRPPDVFLVVPAIIVTPSDIMSCVRLPFLAPCFSPVDLYIRQGRNLIRPRGSDQGTTALCLEIGLH